MNYLSSKELLTEILKENVKEVYEIGSNPNFKDNTLLFNLNGCGELCNINIHELAHKCKEWAYTQGYILFSKIRLNSSLASCYFDTMGKHDYEDDYKNDFRADTEPEAIFKACQWILDNRN